MSSKPPSPAGAQIIVLPSRPSPSRGVVSALLQPIQQKARERLRVALEATFQAADDDLFRRSETGDVVFFSGLRALRRKRPLIAQRFLDALDQDWAAPVEPLPSTAEPSFGELSLVDDQDLEESLAMDSLVGPAEGSFAPALALFQRRWLLLRAGQDAAGSVIPCSPRRVAVAFHESLGERDDLEMPVRIVLYKHFDRHVMAGLGSLYEHINQGLGEAGLLPDATVAPPSGPSLPRVVPSANTVQSMGEAVIAAPVSDASSWADVRQVASRRAVGEGTGRVMPAASPQQLNEALLALRGLSQLFGALPFTDSGPPSVKHRLVQSLRDSGLGERPLGSHEANIDAIGLLFEHILRDQTLASPVRALLARLQLPFIRLAIMHPESFDREDQAGRRLINALGEAGRGWVEGGPRSQEIWERMEAAVNAVQQDSQADPLVFEKRLDIFRAAQDADQQRALAAARRSEEVAKGKDKLASVRALVTKEVVERTAGKSLPDWVRSLLLRHWPAYMMVIVGKEGEESSAFKRALFFVERVVGASDIIDDSGRRALATVLPALTQQLQEGLGAVGLAKEEKASLASLFESYMGSVVKGGDVFARLDEPAQRPNETSLLASDWREALATSSVERGLVEVNDWLEWTDEAGAAHRGRISWISTMTGRILIVSNHGIRMCEKTPEEMSAWLESGNVRPLEGRPLFDRAIGSIMEHLKR